MASDLKTPATRWWPLVMIVLLAVAGIVRCQAVGEMDRQVANMQSIAIGMLAVVLSMLWLLLFSRMPWARRVGFAGVCALLIVGFFALFRFDGVTGNLIPVFASRWAAAPSFTVPIADATQLAAADEDALAGLADFLQFFGPERDGRVSDPGLSRDWRAEPPVEVWRRAVGAGWSGFSVSGRRALTQEQHGQDEVVSCYDVLSGDLLWIHRDPARYDDPLAGLGPRATPTIEGHLVYSMGSTGLLNCLELATGELRWSIDTLAANGASLPEYGVACSPLIVGDLVVVSPGGRAQRSLVAYERFTGEFVWGAGTSSAHWSSPILAQLAGRQQILIFQQELVGHDAVTGAVLWSHPWPTKHPHVALPAILDGDRVLLSSGYGAGCELLEIEQQAAGGYVARSIWKSRRLKAKFANFVTKDGSVYGIDDGILTCVNLTDGSRVWKAGRYGHGQLLLVDDLLLVMAESGEVILLEPVPSEHRELARFTAFADKTWNPPALAGEYLLLRNDREAACYRLPVQR